MASLLAHLHDRASLLLVDQALELLELGLGRLIMQHVAVVLRGRSISSHGARALIHRPAVDRRQGEHERVILLQAISQQRLLAVAGQAGLCALGA